MKTVGNEKAVSDFAARLRRLMQERGHTSAGSRSGVDVAALAQAGQTSYEMARRYAEGAAMPRPDKLAAIAGWLGVSPSALAYGEAEKAGAVDERLLRECIEAIATAQERTETRLSTQKAAQLVALLYQEAQSGKLPALDSLDLLIRAASR